MEKKLKSEKKKKKKKKTKSESLPIDNEKTKSEIQGHADLRAGKLAIKMFISLAITTRKFLYWDIIMILHAN